MHLEGAVSKGQPLLFLKGYFSGNLVLMSHGHVHAPEEGDQPDQPDEYADFVKSV